jgi:hypothetical protein
VATGSRSPLLTQTVSRSRRFRRALTVISAQLSSREVDGRTYWFVDTTVSGTAPSVNLVQCYDEVIISYRQSRAVLQTAGVGFSVPGHDGGYLHVVVIDGRLLGHWRVVRRRGRPAVGTRLVGSTGPAIRRALADVSHRYLDFLAS